MIKNLLLLLLGVIFGVVLVVGVVAAQPGMIALVAGDEPAVTATPPSPTATPAAAAGLPIPAVAAEPTAVRVPEVAGGGRFFADEQVLVELYQRVSPAVVNITNTRGDPTAGEFPRGGAGSGVIFDDRGFILTNNHVVEDATRLEVTLADGSNLPAKLLGRDSANDLAVIQVEAPTEKLPVAPLGDSEELRPGQLAIAIGNPFGLERTITVGIVSSVGRTRADRDRRPIRDMIQTDAAINPGNSGGPLLNSRGEVVGITTAIESPVRGSVGVGFAVPINTAKLHLPEMIAGERIVHPWLGIRTIELTPARSQELGIAVENGVYIASVEPNSPAETAGLRGGVGGSAQEMPRGGDVILSIDGERIVEADDIARYLDRRRVGDVVKVEILRDGAHQMIDVTLGPWPETTGRAAP